MSGNIDMAVASYAGSRSKDILVEEAVANWPCAAKTSGSPLGPCRLDPKLGRESWRADERSLYAAIAEESAQDSQYLTSPSI